MIEKRIKTATNAGNSQLQNNSDCKGETAACGGGVEIVGFG